VVLFVPLAFIFSRIGGLDWFWLTFPVTDSLSTLLGFIWYKKFMRRPYASGKKPDDAQKPEEIIKPSKPGVIITIAREHGSSGKQVGKLVAEKLGIPFYYKEMTALAAQESGLDKEFISDINRNSPDMLHDMYLSTKAVQHAVTAQNSMIRRIAENGSCVIVGRAADYILRGHPDVVRVFIYAPEEYRIAKVMEVYGDTRAEAEKNIRAQFGEEAFSRLPAGEPAAAMALGGLLNYLYETQKTDLSHIRELDYYRQGRFMELDLAARRNLELTETLRSKEKKGSLLWVLDKTKTPMGGRMLRSWLERPLLSVTDIDRRSSAVAALVDDTIRREELIAGMTGLGDMERLIGRIVYGTAGGRDLTSLRAAMEKLPNLKEQLSGFSDRRLTELTAELDTLDDISGDIAAAICDEPPFSVREGSIIRDGFNEEVDRLRHILKSGKGVMAEMEAKEKEKTGIRTLKIGYNKVFGYYIEVSNAFKEQVPETYIRKQTLVNGERFITQELKDLEHEILTASERVVALEYELFSALRQQIADNAGRIQKTAAAVAECDALCSFASVAVHNNFCRPEVDESGVIEIREGRHPVVEKVLKDSLFVPNDTFMGEKEERVAIITGPNMAGKSTYMRQVALIVLMAQMGSFVPAKYAHIGVVDRIFTRIGASDDLSAGQSTFMVEMTEVSDILHQATKNSLLILDEIGRGTSTFDGMAIARAVLEYCADKKTLGAKTLFATHYHELTEMENTLPGTVNYNIAVKRRGEDIIFLRKIIPGGADRSYGIEVAKLAGLPEKVVQRAKVILKELEDENGVQYVSARKETDQVSLDAMSEGEVLDAIRRCQPDTLTPIEAMSLLYELKQKLSK